MKQLLNLKDKITVMLFDRDSQERLMTYSGVNVIRALEEVAKAGTKGYISALYFELPTNLSTPKYRVENVEERDNYNLNLFI